ncbi:hypothetical protein [Paenibacillus shenyangensis]|uniref:hypothetical protein n=1 Tax=Paenibacillus sp. A9 TaxID=1284352 RepID=UPI000376574B|nr:hypothetical protein [Paenibacillus sp. A9]
MEPKDKTYMDADMHPSNYSIPAWQQQMNEQLAPLEGSIRNVQYTEQALEMLMHHQPRLTPAAQIIYRLNALLLIYNHVMQPTHKITGSSPLSLGYHTRMAVTEMQNLLNLELSQSLPALQNEQEWQLLTDMLAYIRQDMLAEVRDSYALLSCYYAFWHSWILPLERGQQLLRDEPMALQQAIPEEELQPGIRRPGNSFAYASLLLAQSYIDFLLEQDDQALEILHAAAERHDFYPERLPDILTQLEQKEQWTRMVRWLVELAPILRRQYSDLQGYGEHWEQAIRHQPEAQAQMWTTLESLLPLGGRLYEDKLLEYGKWQQWMDYQLSSGKDPASYKVTELKPLEMNAPEMLLPFYHQAVERHMAHKNRDGYKAAVRLLKRLSKLYKKLKQEERWEQFIEQFTGRHSRLRALQEELRKGKLIP